MGEDKKIQENLDNNNEELYTSDVIDSKNYFVITPEGKQITIEEYMKTDDYHNKIKAILAFGLSDEQKDELSKLYKK